jgi:subtilisin family serine protease
MDAVKKTAGMGLSMKVFRSLISLSFLIGSLIASIPRSHAQDKQDKVEIFVRWRTESPSEQNSAEHRNALKKVWASSLVPGLKGYVLSDSAHRGEILTNLAKDPRVVYAENNFRIHRKLAPIGKVFSGDELRSLNVFSLPNDPMLSRQWAMTTSTGVRAIEAWTQTQGSLQIKVAVIDTGVEQVADLAGRVLAGYDFIDNSPNVRDSHGHGTHVAGIIGALSNNGVGVAGINPSVSILPIRAVPNDSDESDADVIAAFEFAVQNGARVANCSFGKAESSQAVGDSIEAAGKAGLLVVVAAGNDGVDNNSQAIFPANFRTSNMIVVAASTTSGALSFFSNYGLGMVDVAAPGSNIMSTVTGNQYASFSGTSMASPQVAGVAALTLSANPALTVDQLKAILLQTATKDPLLANKVSTGARIDALLAVNAAHKSLLSTENP